MDNSEAYCDDDDDGAKLCLVSVVLVVVKLLFWNALLHNFILCIAIYVGIALSQVSSSPICRF